MSWAQPAYDAAGNMTSGPKSGAGGTKLHFAYDGWGRQVAVYADSGGSPGTLLASYEYDGRGYKIQRTESGTTQDTYFNEGWQALEVRSGGDADPLEQWVWDPRYVDAAVVRFYDGNTDGDYADAADSTLYPTHDANFNVTALVNGATGSVVERYLYEPYGKFTVLNGAADADGAVTEWTADAGGSSDWAWPLLHQGGRHDGTSGEYDFRNRPYNAGLGAWPMRDFAGYVDGAKLYEYVRSLPTLAVDPSGLQAASSQPAPSAVGTISGTVRTISIPSIDYKAEKLDVSLTGQIRARYTGSTTIGQLNPSNYVNEQTDLSGELNFKNLPAGGATLRGKLDYAAELNSNYEGNFNFVGDVVVKPQGLVPNARVKRFAGEVAARVVDNKNCNCTATISDYGTPDFFLFQVLVPRVTVKGRAEAPKSCKDIGIPGLIALVKRAVMGLGRVLKQCLVPIVRCPQGGGHRWTDTPTT